MAVIVLGKYQRRLKDYIPPKIYRDVVNGGRSSTPKGMRNL